MNVLVNFALHCGRMGDLSGLFVCTRDELAGLIDKEVYFGEVLGKHSEIVATLDASNLSVVSDDQERIAWLESVVGNKTISGHNPLQYLEDYA